RARGDDVHAATSARAKSCGSNGRRSSSPSPTPTSLTGSPSSYAIATAMPPFAEPSSFVSATPVTPTASLKMRACCSPFCPVLAQLVRELADGRRLPGAVHADDEDHGRRVVYVEYRGISEERGDLVREGSVELRQILACLEPADQLRGRAHAHVRVDERFLEPLPRRVVGGVERGDLQLLGQGAPRLAERVSQAAEEAALRLGRLVGRVAVAQELSPAS